MYVMDLKTALMGVTNPHKHVESTARKCMEGSNAPVDGRTASTTRRNATETKTAPMGVTNPRRRVGPTVKK